MMEKKKPTTITGKIGEIGFSYKITTKAQHKEVLKDLRALAKQMKQVVKDPHSQVMKRISHWREKTNELQKQNKEMEKKLKMMKNFSLIETFRSLIREEIYSYKNWEILEILERESAPNVHSRFTRNIDTRIKKVLAGEKK